MKQFFIVMICVFAVGVTSLSVSARPKKRFDETTGTCRVLNVGPLEWESLPWARAVRVSNRSVRVVIPVATIKKHPFCGKNPNLQKDGTGSSPVGARNVPKTDPGLSFRKRHIKYTPPLPVNPVVPG